MYLLNIFLPLRLSADYVPVNVLWISLPVAILVLMVFVLAQGAAGWKSRVAFFGAIVFWAGLAPVSNFIPIYRFAADRYLYLPMAGMALMVVGVAWISCGGRRARIAWTAGLLAALLGLGNLSLQRQLVFSDSLSLWRDTLAKSPTSETAANNYASQLLDEMKYDQALPAFVDAVKISRGKNASIWCGLAFTLEKLNRPGQAETALERAIALRPIYRDPDRLVAALLVTRARAEVIGQIAARLPAKSGEAP